MWFQIKTLLTSILLLMALCFGANANFDALNRTDAKIIAVGSEQTGYQIKGGLEIVTVAVPGAVIKTLKHLKTEGKLPNSTSNRAGGKDDANSVLSNVPGRVQTRVNLAVGTTRFTPINDAGNPVQAGWIHVTNRHFGSTNTQSQFTLSQTEVRNILQSDRVVSAPVSEIKMINGTPTYVRTVDVGTRIGTVRQSNGGGSTSNLYVQTDSADNLITAFPVP